MSHAIQGVHCAAATPVDAQGRPDSALFTSHCRKLLEEGCHGIAMLGTTGEANSFSSRERMELLDSAIKAGIPADCMLPGTSSPSIAETIEMTRHAVELGVKGVVLLPPYYYKGVTDEGLFRFYARVIEGVCAGVGAGAGVGVVAGAGAGDNSLRVVLYHIPQVTQVPITHELIERLMQAFPDIVCGIKDSAGDLANMQAMCERFPKLGVLAGADPLMLPLLNCGGAGCITATSNLRPDALRTVWDMWQDPAAVADVQAAQDRINAWRELSNTYTQLPTVKTMLARSRKDQQWLNLMPPLVELSAEQQADIWSKMEQLEAS